MTSFGRCRNPDICVTGGLYFLISVSSCVLITMVVQIGCVRQQRHLIDLEVAELLFSLPIIGTLFVV